MNCQECDDEVEELVRIKIGRKVFRLCEACAERHQEQAEIADGAESAMREMMEYKGR